MKTILPRFRRQFSLASLLAVMLVVCVGASLYGFHLRALQRQEVAFQQLSAKGFSITVYDEGTYVMRGPLWGLCGTGLKRVVDASAQPAPFGDADLPLLDDVIKLRSADFTGTGVTPAAIANFKSTHPQCSVH
jgi:hypothetical protein